MKQDTWFKPTVLAATIASVIGGWALIRGISEAQSVPARVLALEESQRQMSERFNNLAFDVKALASESQNAARRSEESQNAMRATLTEINGNMRSLSATLNDHTAKLMQTQEQVKNALVLIDNMAAHSK
jgi:seryl-tRNA synthetase